MSEFDMKYRAIIATSKMQDSILSFLVTNGILLRNSDAYFKLNDIDFNWKN
jgi:hypothetical protein